MTMKRDDENLAAVLNRFESAVSLLASAGGDPAPTERAITEISPSRLAIASLAW